MDAIFLKILNMSIMAVWLILTVILLRLLFKKAPKWLRCILWAFVAIRLVCPVSFESVWSLIPSPETVNPEILYTQAPAINSGSAAFNNTVNPIISETFAAKADAQANPLQSMTQIASWIWIAGIAAMLVYAAICYIHLRRKLKIAMLLRENIWLCDSVESPFILGIVKPRIYIPSNMAEEQIHLVLAHENAHLKRRDHLWKPFGYLLLAVYWFNPFCWLAYWLLCRDIEFACDEKVTKALDPNGKKAYAEVLLSCSVNHRAITACPLAFGEAGVKERVKSVLHYRKPAFWVILAAMAACFITAICLLTNPAGIKIDEIKQYQGSDTLLKDVRCIGMQSGNTVYTVNTQQEIETLLRQINEIRIYKNPLSRNRSEDREQTNRIVLQYDNDSYKTIYFNKSYNALWVDDGINPAPTYRIKKPDDVKRLFTLSGSQAIGMAGQYQAVSCVFDCGIYSNLPPVGEQYAISQEMVLLDTRNENQNVQYNTWHAIGRLTEMQLTKENFDDLLQLAPVWETGYSASKLRKNNEKAWCAAESRKDASEAGSVYYVLLQKDGSIYLSIVYPVASRVDNANARIRCILKMQAVQTAPGTGGAGQTECSYLSYIYAGSGSSDPFLRPAILLHQNDKTFQFNDSLLSSYHTIGTYELTGEELTLRTYDGTRVYVFSVNEKNHSFIYDAGKSYGMPLYGTEDGAGFRPMIPDGAEFIAGSWSPL